MRLGATWIVMIVHALGQEAPNPLKFGVPVPAGSVAIINGRLISEADFINEMTSVHLRPTGEGGRVLDALVDTALVDAAMSKRGLSVNDADVETKLQEIGRAYESTQGGKTLAQVLKENNVTMESFRSRMRQVVALEILAREDLSLPKDAKVENLHLRTWLSNARQTATIILDAEKLPADAAAMLNGAPISKKDLVVSLMSAMEPERTARTVENLLQAESVQQLLEERALKIDDKDILEEWQHRKRSFSKNPVYAGIRYEDMVTQQTGLTPQAIQASRAFRANTGIGKLARTCFDKPALEAAYQEHTSRYGPRLTVRHILIAANDNPFQNNQGIPTIAQGKTRAEYILQELEKGTRFEELVGLYSADTGTKPNGGLIPEFTPGRNSLEHAIVEAALKLEVGEVSPPVQTRHGWHLVRLDSRKETPPLSDPDVEADLRRFLADRMVSEAYKAATIGMDIRIGR
jgi:parvulin-like peptidyl-prolyl isomerase